MAAELPGAARLLAFLELALQGLELVLGVLQLGLGLGAGLLGLLGPLVGLVQLLLQLLGIDPGAGLIFFTCIQPFIELVNGLLQFQFPLLGLVGQRVHVSQHVVFVKTAEHTGAEPLILNGWFL